MRPAARTLFAEAATRPENEASKVMLTPYQAVYSDKILQKIPSERSEEAANKTAGLVPHENTLHNPIYLPDSTGCHGADGKVYFSEKDAMNDANYFSIRSFSLSYFHTLVEHWGGRNAIADMTTAHICSQKIKPMTRDSGLSLCAQTYFDQPDLLKDADWFVSHAWSYCFLDLLDALDHFCESKGMDPASTHFWFDCMTVSQHEANTSTKNFDIWVNLFSNAIQKIGNFVLIVQPWENPVPLTRSWCLFEICAAHDNDCNFQIAMTDSQKDGLLASLFSDGAKKYYNILQQIDMEKSEAQIETDKEQILNLARGIGFQKLHRNVFESISNWIIQELHASIGQEVDDSMRQKKTTTLADFYMQAGLYTHAEALYIECLQIREKILGKEHPSTLISINNLAHLYESQGKYDQAEPLYVECHEISVKVLGQHHLSTLTSINNLAGLYKSQGKYEQAEPLYMECLQLEETIFGRHHPSTLISINNLADLYESQGKYDQAEPLYVECLEVIEKFLGRHHPSTLISINNLAGLYESQGKYDQAEPLYVECLHLKEKILGREHPSTLVSVNNLADLYDSQGKFDQAESLYVECCEISVKVLGPQHPSTLTSMNNLAGLYKRQAKYDQAEPLYVKCLQLREKTLGRQHPSTLTSINNLAGLHECKGEYEVAEPLYVECCEASEKLLGRQHPFTLTSINNLAGLYESQGKHQTKLLYQEYLKAEEKILE